MEDDVLSKVIETEEEIQNKLEREKQKAAQWLEKIREGAEKEVSRKEDDLKKSFADDWEAIRKHAELRASEIVNRAREKAAIIAITDDNILRKHVSGRLKQILPGG